MRKLLIAFVLSTMVAVSMPLIMGYVYHYRFQHGFNHLPLPSGIQYEVTHYQRHWFDSRIKIKLLLDSPSIKQVYHQFQAELGAKDPKKLWFNLDVSVNHGPFLLDIESTGKRIYKFGLAMAYVQLTPGGENLAVLHKVFGHRPILTGKTLIDLSSMNGTTWLKSPAFKYQLSTQYGVLIWKGLSGVWQLYNRGNSMREELDIYGLSYASTDYSWKLSDVKIERKLLKHKDNLWVGDTDSKMGAFGLLDNRYGYKLNVKDLRLNSTSEVKNNFLSYATYVEFKEVSTEEKKYGPMMTELTLSNIDPDGLADFQQWAKSPGGDDITDIESKEHLREFLPIILGKGAMVKIKEFSLDVPEGEIKFDGQMTLGHFTKGEDFGKAIQNSLVEAQISMPPKFVRAYVLNKVLEQRKENGQENILSEFAYGQTTSGNDIPVDDAVENVIHEWSSKGIIRRTPDSVNMHVKYVKGRLLVNGKPVE